jgi:hypothetical protein
MSASNWYAIEEMARQRRQELLAEAERERVARRAQGDGKGREGGGKLVRRLVFAGAAAAIILLLASQWLVASAGALGVSSLLPPLL